jgi:hypothetical protein
MINQLHGFTSVEGNEPLNWYVRMRIIMGIAYYLQHIHELDPCIAHPDLCSSFIFLTEDLAAKVNIFIFQSELIWFWNKLIVA